MTDHNTLANFGPAVLAVQHTMLDAGAEAAEELAPEQSGVLLMSALALCWFLARNDDTSGAQELYETIEANGAAFMAGMVRGARDAGRLICEGSGAVATECAECGRTFEGAAVVPLHEVKA